PPDSGVLTGSLNQARMGRAFALPTFSGNLGNVAAPSVTAVLMLLVGWRSTLALVGLLGVPLVLTILWQGHILHDHARRRDDKPASGMSGGGLLLARPLLLFFAFFLFAAMATAGLQAWLVTVLHEVHGMDLKAASTALTGFMIGATSGVLVGGFVAERTDRHLLFAVILTIAAAALLLAVGL